VAIEDKYDRVKRLMEVGKERGYVLYDEVSDVLPADLNGGGDLDDVLAGFDGAGIEILEDPKPEFDKKLEDGEDVLDLELPPGIGEKTNDPVRMYLREMGAVALLTRESEVEIAKRIERGQRAVSKALSRSPLVIHKIIALGDEVRSGAIAVRDVIIFNDPLISEDLAEERKAELIAAIADIGKYYKKAQQVRQKLLAVPRGTKPKLHRHMRWEVARTTIKVSRLVRGIKFNSTVMRQFIDCIRGAVDELKPLERDMARVQRKMEGPSGDRAEIVKELRK
jgi:RNA polymerase primary sigma factor